VFEAAFHGRRKHAVQLAAQGQKALTVRVSPLALARELALEDPAPRGGEDRRHPALDLGFVKQGPCRAQDPREQIGARRPHHGDRLDRACRPGRPGQKRDLPLDTGRLEHPRVHRLTQRPLEGHRLEGPDPDRRLGWRNGHQRGAVIRDVDAARVVRPQAKP